MKVYIKYIASIILLLVMISCINNKSKSTTSKVEIKFQDGKYMMYCNDKPFFIKGAGLEGGNVKALAKHGGNAYRTWRTNSTFRTGDEMLQEAKHNGMMVCMGLEIGRERHGFDYNDSIAVQEQFEKIKGEVLKYKDHPSLLAWGIGNELNLRYTNPKVWVAVNEIAKMIHEVDPNHPTTTMLAGAGKSEVEHIKLLCPDLDFLCFQIYGEIMKLPQYIKESGWEGPYVISEWGATGHWEVKRTSWGRPIEQMSHEKAMAYKERYEKVILNDENQCLGSFVFLWGQKQERTPTWYGMYLESGDRTESVDVMEYVWTGKWPKNRTPQVLDFKFNRMTAYDNIIVNPGSLNSIVANIFDPDEDELTCRFEILPEVPENKMSDGGDFEERPKSLMNKTLSAGESTLSFKAPEIVGEYRIFIYVTDGNSSSGTANIPFLVKNK